MGRNWVEWHNSYDDAESPLSQRLPIVQGHIREALDAQPAGPISVISMCAGQARDLLGVLPEHQRRDDVRATLVELDPHNAERARLAVAGLDVDVITADAGVSTPYRQRVPADIALVCGVFGNIPDRDIQHTVEWLPRLCRRGATVIWTRHRKPPDRTVEIRNWFARAGFDEVAFDGADTIHIHIGVGTHVFTGQPLPFQPDRRLFTFTG